MLNYDNAILPIASQSDAIISNEWYANCIGKLSMSDELLLSVPRVRRRLADVNRARTTSPLWRFSRFLHPFPHTSSLIEGCLLFNRDVYL